MINTPCKDCPNKGCGVYHDECKEYQAWITKNAEIKAKTKGEKDAKHFIIERVFDTKDFMRKH